MVKIDKNGENRQKMVLLPSKMVLPPSLMVLPGDGLGAVLISHSQPKILRKIQKNLQRYISAISRFLHVWEQQLTQRCVVLQIERYGSPVQ